MNEISDMKEMLSAAALSDKRVVLSTRGIYGEFGGEGFVQDFLGARDAKAGGGVVTTIVVAVPFYRSCLGTAECDDCLNNYINRVDSILNMMGTYSGIRWRWAARVESPMVFIGDESGGAVASLPPTIMPPFAEFASVASKISRELVPEVLEAIAGPSIANSEIDFGAPVREWLVEVPWKVREVVMSMEQVICLSKHSGKRFSEVLSDDSDYVRWAIGQDIMYVVPALLDAGGILD